MKVLRSRARYPLAIATLLLALFVAPAGADTKSELDAAERRAAQIQAELSRATAAHQAAVAKYEGTLDEIALTRQRISKTRARLDRIRAGLAERARRAYQNGPAATLELMLSSSSFSELTDRAEFLNRLSQEDADLIVQVQVTREQLSREEADLEALSSDQAAAAAQLREQQDIIDRKFAEAAALVETLEERFAGERRAAAIRDSLGGGGGTPTVGSGTLRVCPVDAPNAFGNDFGAPRSGGRTHQGNDIFAAAGTSIRAPFDGRAEDASNSVGGIAVYVYGAGGYVYNAHASSIVKLGAVSAGDVIARVGNSGNAQGTSPHDHFEWHPGSGGAVNPYPYLVDACR